VVAGEREASRTGARTIPPLAACTPAPMRSPLQPRSTVVFQR
jgi:hypothetical protein